MEYKFKFKRKFFYKTIKAVGHVFMQEADRMDVYSKDGSVESINKWSECYLKLGTDWVLAVKDQMEQESGQEVKLKSNIGE